MESFSLSSLQDADRLLTITLSEVVESCSPCVQSSSPLLSAMAVSSSNSNSLYNSHTTVITRQVPYANLHT